MRTTLRLPPPVPRSDGGATRTRTSRAAAPAEPCKPLGGALPEPVTPRSMTEVSPAADFPDSPSRQNELECSSSLVSVDAPPGKHRAHEHEGAPSIPGDPLNTSLPHSAVWSQSSYGTIMDEDERPITPAVGLAVGETVILLHPPLP